MELIVSKANRYQNSLKCRGLSPFFHYLLIVWIVDVTLLIMVFKNLLLFPMYCIPVYYCIPVRFYQWNSMSIQVQLYISNSTSGGPRPKTEQHNPCRTHHLFSWTIAFSRYSMSLPTGRPNIFLTERYHPCCEKEKKSCLS